MKTKKSFKYLAVMAIYKVSNYGMKYINLNYTFRRYTFLIRNRHINNSKIDILCEINTRWYPIITE